MTMLAQEDWSAIRAGRRSLSSLGRYIEYFLFASVREWTRTISWLRAHNRDIASQVTKPDTPSAETVEFACRF